MDSSEIDARLLREYPLMFLEMNDAQERFIRVRNRFGRTPKRRIFEAGNKVGKCLTYSTLIETPDGEVSVGSLFEKGKPFRVYAWDGQKKVVADAGAPFKKEGVHRCYRIEMSDGRWVEAADLHRILCDDGAYRNVFELAAFFLCVQDNHIISIKPVKSQVVYDFTVEKYHNYFAGGLIHHNSEIGIAEDIAYSVGYRAWLPSDDPDHKVNVKVPNIGLIACETMMHSVAEKIEPTLRKLIPKTCQPVFKPGSAGILIKVTLPYGCYGEKCGSTIYIRSYDQRADSFEGIDYDGYVHWDEPPPLDMFRAVERGKMVANADSWFTMTPLKQAWVYDLFSSKAAVVV